jgi:hypothetical protein
MDPLVSLIRLIQPILWHEEARTLWGLLECVFFKHIFGSGACGADPTVNEFKEVIEKTSKGQRNPLGGFIWAPFGFSIPFPTPKG